MLNSVVGICTESRTFENFKPTMQFSFGLTKTRENLLEISKISKAVDFSRTVNR